MEMNEYISIPWHLPLTEGRSAPESVPSGDLSLFAILGCRNVAQESPEGPRSLDGEEGRESTSIKVWIMSAALIPLNTGNNQHFCFRMSGAKKVIQI